MKSNDRQNTPTNDILAFLLYAWVILLCIKSQFVLPTWLGWIVLLPFKIVRLVPLAVALEQDQVILFSILVGFPLLVLYWVGWFYGIRMLIKKISE